MICCWHCQHHFHADCELRSRAHVQTDLNGGEVGMKEELSTGEAQGQHRTDKNTNLGDGHEMCFLFGLQGFIRIEHLRPWGGFSRFETFLGLIFFSDQPIIWL
jgi:hypothetical protein